MIREILEGLKKPKDFWVYRPRPNSKKWEYSSKEPEGSDKYFTLKTRSLDFEIFLGSLDHLNKKINNLKAFYQKAMKDQTLTNYKKVNLQFENQVVCTKK